MTEPADTTHAAADDLLAFGRSPRPGTAAEFARRLRESAFAGDSDWTLLHTDRIAIEAELDGADVARLAIDASGVAMRLEPGASGNVVAAASGATPPERLHTTEATLRSGVFRADPVHVQDVPVTVEAEVGGIPFGWVDLADGALAVDIRPDEADRLNPESSVRLLLATDVAAATKAIADAIRPAMAEEGVGLDRERVTLRQLGPRRVRFDARARVKWKIFRLRGHFRGVLEVDRRNVLRVRDARLSVSNPILNLALRGFARELLQEFQQPIDLESRLGAWTIKDLRLKAGRLARVELELIARS